MWPRWQHFRWHLRPTPVNPTIESLVQDAPLEVPI